MKTTILKSIGIAAIVVILFCFGATSHAQEYEIRFDHPFVLDMPINQAIIQDQDGFLWLGTQNGLVRYDGYETTIYRTGPNSISNDNVAAIFEDTHGVLWMGTVGGGITRYDKESNTFTHLRHNPDDPNSLISDVISYSSQALYVDSSDTLWIGTQTGGLDRYDIATGTFTNYQHDPEDPDSLIDNFVFSIMEDHLGRIWIGTGAGLDRFDPDTETFTHYLHDPDDPNTLGAPWVSRLRVDKDDPDIIWLGTVGGGLNKFDMTTETFTRYSQDPSIPDDESIDGLMGLEEDDQGRLWIGWWQYPVEGGLSLFDKETESFVRHYHTDPNDPYSLSSDVVIGVYQDRSGIMWLGNQLGSIDKYDREAQKFRLYQHDPNNPDSLSDNSGVPYYEDREGVMWIGTVSGGLNRYNADTDTFTHYAYDPDDPDSIRHNFVTRIYEDSSGTFWIATRGGALSIFDRQTGQCTRHYIHDPDDPTSIPQFDSIRYIIEDQDDPNILWMGAFWQGFFSFNKETEEFTVHQPDINAVHLYQDADGIIWISTLASGFFRFDKTTGEFVQYAQDPDNPDGLGTNQIFEVHEFTPGYLWVATVGGGLARFDKENQTFQIYNKANGFPSNAVMTVRQDNSGNLWMGTDEGLVRFNPDTEEIRVYRKGDGLQGDVFLDAAAWFTHDGQMWFGGVNGVNSFYPDQIRDNPNVPSIVLTSLTQGGEEIGLDRALTELQAVEFDWQDNFFEFGYAALNYTLPEKNQYAYMLEGYDKDWYQAGTQRFGRYSGLPPGNYTLRIKGSNNDGIWNEEGIALQITIVPPFWRRVWFQGLIIVTVLGAVLGGFALRFRSMREQKRQLEIQVMDRTRELEEARKVEEKARQAAEKANQSKSVFLAHMSHELRTPLNAILGYAQVLKRRPLDPDIINNLDTIQQSGEHLLTLINDVLDIAKIEAGKIELYPAPFYLPGFMQGIAGIFYSRAAAKNLSFSYDVVGDPPQVVNADETRLRQVLFNLLDNAVKFTDAGQVILRLRCLGEPVSEARHPQSQVRVRFEVEDTGIGIESEQIKRVFEPFEQVSERSRRAEGSGLGLAISRQLVQLMGSDLQVKSEPAQGSLFSFDVALLVADEVLVEVEPPPDQIITSYKGPQYTILVVDDIASNRNILVDMLTPLGFKTIEAEDGQSAVKKAQEILPDLILMDRRMPVMNGFESMLQIRQISQLAQVPIIAVSASVSDEDRVLSQEVGFDAFLPKPVSWPNLASLLKRHLKLKWIYAEKGEKPSRKRRAVDELVPPPRHELIVLLDLAKQGDMRAIKDSADRIEALGEQYHPFTDQLRRMVNAFEDKALLNLIMRYLE
ncbi:MAG: response regulator [Anaerolineae bacterium]|nr:response regulator [Anaerolineae bacterium]